MKITIREEDHKIECGDILVCWHNDGGQSMFVFSETDDVVQVINLTDGRVTFSIFKDRGFEQLVEHVKSCFNSKRDEDTVIDYLIAKHEDTELVIRKTFTI